MSISIMEAMRLAAPNCVALLLVRDNLATLPKESEDYARLKEQERQLAYEIADCLLKIDWRSSAAKLAQVVAEARKKNEKES